MDTAPFLFHDIVKLAHIVDEFAGTALSRSNRSHASAFCILHWIAFLILQSPLVPKMWIKLKAKSDRRILGWFPKRYPTFHAVNFLLLEV